MGKNKNGMLDHSKGEVLRIQLYTRMYSKENKLLNEICQRYLKEINPKMDKSDFLRRVLLRGLKEVIKELE